MVISVQAEPVDNAILPDYLTSDVALEEPEIGSTDPNIPTENNCMEDQLHFGMPWGSGDYQDEGDASDMCNAISTACRRQWLMTELQRFDLGNSNVNEYEGKDRNKADADEEQEASLGHDGSTQNLEELGYSRFDMGTCDINGYEYLGGADVHMDGEVEASPADNGSTQYVED
jgi:hypothetical protein